MAKNLGYLIAGAGLLWLLWPKKKPQKATLTAHSGLFQDWRRKEFEAVTNPYRLKADASAGTLYWVDEAGPIGLEPTWAGQAKARDAGNIILARLRARSLPSGAKPGVADGFSNMRIAVPYCPNQPNGPAVDSGYNVPQCSTLVVDEYGRIYEGTFGGGSTFAGGIAFIIKTAAPYVAMAYPPAAPFIYAGLAAYEARGKGLSFKSVAVSAARSQVPPQYQFAFDVGAGIASGKDPDQAVVDAYLESNPQAKAYVELGKKTYKQSSGN